MVTRVELNSILCNLEAERGMKFALLLGAGTSHSSGIPTAKEICNDLKKRLFLSNQGMTLEQLPYVDLDQAVQWYLKQGWYVNRQGESEYSLLMRTYNQTEAARTNYIENLMEGKKPSQGLLSMATAIKKVVFDVVLTTNFDRLIEDALRIVEAKLPVVVNYDDSIDRCRLTDSRPKIIKLHGDFLYNPANLDSETSEIRVNMKAKLEHVLTEYGLIVVGYGGNDKSVMNILKEIASKHTGCPFGLYWLNRAGDEISSLSLDLLDNWRNAFFCAIESADQFFHALVSHLKLEEGLLTARPNIDVSVRVESAQPAVETQTSVRSLASPPGSFKLHDPASATMADLNMSAVVEFFTFRQSGDGNPTESDALQMLLEEGLVVESEDGLNHIPTYTSLLLFGRNPRKILPAAFVKSAFFKSPDEIVQEEIHGTVGEVIDRALAFVSKYNDKTRNIRSVPVKDVFDFPPIAVREAMANAVAHRDYTDMDRSVSVYIYSDRIEMASPGGLIPVSQGKR